MEDYITKRQSQYLAAKYLLEVRERNTERRWQRWQTALDWLANITLALAVITLLVMMRG